MAVDIQTVHGEKYNMSYLYFGDTDRFVKEVAKTNGILNTVSPSYFNIEADGSLNIAKIDPTLIKEMHKENVKVVPFLSNHWNRDAGRKALNDKTLVDDLVKAIMDNNLDGINIDIENMTELDRDNYTNLVKGLRNNLPSGKEVSVAVAVNPFAVQIGWQGSYDYKELAKYSDYLMLMAYDESYSGGPAGPVASLPFVEKSIQYALSEGVPSDKIVLGLALYGRYWKDGKGGTGIPNYRVEELVKEYNGKVSFDSISQTPYATVTIPNGEAPKVHYWTLKPGKYTIWFENETSLRTKLELVDKYDLKGTGSWSLTDSTSDTWDYFAEWLAGDSYYIDVYNHWAKADIKVMKENGWMVGTTDKTFTPNKPLTRAEGTVVLVRALGLDKEDGEQLGIQSPFSDIPNHWAKKEIEIAYQNGLIRGIDVDKFAPNKPLTRAEMAAILDRVTKEKNKVEIADISKLTNPFPDLNKNYWAYKEIIEMNNRSIFSGMADGNFHPNEKVTRAQMAALMNRTAIYIK